MNYTFLYQDQLVSQPVIDGYIVGEVIHENGYVYCSTLRGGLLTNANIRYLFIHNVGGVFFIVNEDWRKQGLYIFDYGLYYDIYDKYQVGGYTQILLSPDNVLTDIPAIIQAARKDFNELLHTPPVGILNTAQWRNKFRQPLGVDGKNNPHQLLP
jgi:hypothetical protein